MKKRILAICGSTRKESANLFLIQHIVKLMSGDADFEIYDLCLLPYFNPDLDKGKAPGIVEVFREKIRNADGVLICTPEYVFSLPGVLKNAIEWCVSTTVFSGKPVALITASASGAAAHASLQLVMKTIEADLRNETQLLIQGAKGKIDPMGAISHPATAGQLQTLSVFFKNQLIEKGAAHPLE